MIEGIYQIGSVVKKGKRISEIAADIPPRRQDVIYKIGKINFNFGKDIIEINLDEEYELGDEEKYKFVQLKLTGRQNQFFATFRNIKRFVGEIEKRKNEGKKYAVWLSIEDELASLYSKADNETLKEEIKNFLSQLRLVNKHFYKDFMIDFSKIKNFVGKDLTELKKFINRQLGRKEDIIFWTVLINNEKVIDKGFYDILLKKKILDDKKKKGNVSCFLCNRSINEYFNDFARLPIKFFINDKVGFSQKLANRWEGNFVLCEDCYLSLFAGEKFLLNNFKSRIGAITFLIVPEFMDKLPVGQDGLKKWSELVKNIYNPFALFEKDDFKNLLEDYQKFGYISYSLLNYIFYEQNNQQFKIFTIVKDIPESRLDELRRRFHNYRAKYLYLFPEFKDYRLKSFEDVYWIVPLRQRKENNKKKILDITKLTNLFASLLEGIKLRRFFLTHEFWIGLKAKFFRNKSYHNVSDAENTEAEMNKYILKTHQFLFLLKELNLLNGGTEVEIRDIPKEIRNYIQEVGFDEKETALFLLGTLIGDIGSKQANFGNKPILNKINFQGMSLSRLQILFNEVYEKLEQEKLLYPERELIYGRAKELFDKHLRDWNLKPYESVYCLLSGYAYKTKFNIEKAKEKKAKEKGGNENEQ